MIVYSPLYRTPRSMRTMIICYDYDVFSRARDPISPEWYFSDHIVQKINHVHFVRSVNYVKIKIYLIFVSTHCTYYSSALSTSILVV